jgi:hypothetical protein
MSLPIPFGPTWKNFNLLLRGGSPLICLSVHAKATIHSYVILLDFVENESKANDYTHIGKHTEPIIQFRRFQYSFPARTTSKQIYVVL